MNFYLKIVLMLVGFWLTKAPSAFAGDLPEILGHSQTSFGVYRGDTISFEVRARGEHLESKWIKGHEIFCRELSCDVDTSNWSLGSHGISLVVFNASGSAYLRYTIKILATPPGYKPGKVHPPFVDSGLESERVATDDLTVRTVNGRGYSYHQKKLQVVGPEARTLEWTEKLRTQAASTMRFGRDGHESHVLAERSAVYLVKGESGRRAIALVKGTIRSRNLSSADPRWSILADEWLQVDTDSMGDVLVTRKVAKSGENEEAKADKVTVTVLRGNARVFLHRPKGGKEQGEDDGVAINVAQGLSVTARRGDKDFAKPTLPNSKMVKKIGALVAETTPQYLPGQRPTDAGSGQTVMGDKAVPVFKDGLRLAVEAKARRDFIVAIEALAPFAAEAAKSYDASLVLGEAYQGIFLYAAAEKVLTAATELEPDAPRPYFVLGEIALAKRDWNEAVKNFEAADERGEPNQQLLNYYLGIARYNANDNVGAHSAFTYSLWDQENTDVATSARQFRGYVQEEGWLDLHFGGGLFYDSNILRSDKIDPTTVSPGIKTRKGAGYVGEARFSLWPARGDVVNTELYFDGSRRGYLSTAFNPLVVIDQKLGMNISMGFGGITADEHVFAAEFGGYVGTIIIGDQRALDEMGGHIAMGSPAMLGLKLGVDALVGLDPLPAKDKLLDPIRWEVSPSGERSAHVLYYTLGLKPVNGETFKLGMDVRSGGAVYRSDLHRDENFKDLGLGLDGSYSSNIRSEVDFGLHQTTRTFPNADDHRKDTTLTLGAGWKWYYTTALYHVMDFTYETQKSSRDVNAYKRQVYGYKLNLDF